VVGARAGPTTPTRAGYPYLVQEPDQLGGVGILAGRQPRRQVPATSIADGVQLGGQPAP
jgi:hypothetical protein